MKQSLNRIITMILAFVAAVCFTFAVATGLNTAKADDTQIFGVKSVSVYLGTENNDDTGIRFTAQINKAKYDAIVDGSAPVFFGIELSVNDANPMDIVYTVGGNTSGQDGFKVVDFGSGTVYEYTATIMYNEDKLAEELAGDENFNPNNLSVEDYKASEDFAKYMQSAFKTEITAKAYYQVGDKTEAQKNYGDESLTRSIWGVGSYTFVEFDGSDEFFDEQGNFVLVDKYFANASTLENVTVNEYGTIEGYTFDGTEKAIYFNGKAIDVTNNKVSTDLVEGLVEGEALAICIVTADGGLVKLDAECDMIAEVIESEAIYDATAQKIYYETENGVQIIDATNAYYVEENTEYELVKNEYLFNKKDAVTFRTDSYHIDDVKSINADLTVETENGTVVKDVEIAYDVATANYAGVKMLVKNSDGELLYSLTDVVFATAVIDDGAELKEVFNKADKNAGWIPNSAPDNATYGNIAKGVFMLADDIDASEEGKEFVFDNSYLNFFDGLLDGRGHNIYNLNVSGTAAKPGNGLFSAISTKSSIQNIGFIDVVANYGSVFQGNSAELNSSLGTYATMYSNNAWSNNIGIKQYRSQLGIPDDDTTTPITNYLTTVWRVYDGTAHPTSEVYSNLYVKVSSNTTNFMGVFSRDLKNAHTQLRAYNTVIEYLPTDKTWVPDDYSQSGYGVLFGGAFNVGLEVASTAETKTKTWYNPAGVETGWSGAGVLNYVRDDLRYNGYATKIVVISDIGLVSCVKGSILDTNDTVTDANPYKFYSQKAYGWTAGQSERGNLLSYVSMDAYMSESITAYEGHSYFAETTATYKYWNYDGHLTWKNLPVA